jgi:hypothetical protein
MTGVSRPGLSLNVVRKPSPPSGGEFDMRAIAVGLLLPLAGCATLGGLDRPGAETALRHGLESYEQQDFQTAYDQLSWIYANFWDRPVGERSLLALAAVELDPRNPGRRLREGADLASWYPTLPFRSAWQIPVSRTLEGLARELDVAYEEIARLQAENEWMEERRVAAVAEVARAERAAATARADANRARAEARQLQAASAPRIPPSRPAEVRTLQADRDRLAREVSRLRTALEEREQELRRIRETIVQ